MSEWRRHALATFPELRAVILLIALLGCASVSSPATLAKPAEPTWPACYELHVGAWSPAHGWPLISIAPPRVVQLDTMPPPRVIDPDARRLTPDIPVSAARGWFSPVWRRLAPDSLELVWSGGFGGLFVFVAQHGDSLSGEARAWSDAPESGIAPVTGWRVSCDRMAPSVR
jgi:hypothetical protein